MDRIAILVAGMHRSGTSALTRMLNGLGCDLPAALMEADEYNVEGYWESTEVVALNEAVLASAGSTWDDWEPFNPDWHASPVAEGFRSRARAVIESEFGDSPLFVFKDPRVCRLLDFWIDALADCGVDARIALPIRNPLEVAASLEARDAIDPSVGLLLWLRHVLDAEYASRGHPRAFVRFDALLGNWQPVTDAMGEAFGVVWPKRSTTAGIEIESGFVPTGRHHVRDDASLPSSAEVSRWVSEAFAIVDRWTHSNARKADTGRLNALRSAFDEAAAVFGRAVATGMRAGQRNRVLEREMTTLNAVVSDREGQIDSLDRAVADRDENVGYLNGLVAKKDEQIASLDALVEDRDRQIDALNHVVAGRDGQIAGRDKSIDDLQGVARAKDQELDALGGVVADRDRQIDALNHVVAGRDGQIADGAEKIEYLEGLARAKDQELDALGGVVADRDRQIDALNHVVAGRDGQITARDERIDDLEGVARAKDQELAALGGVVADRDGQITARDERIDDLEGVARAKDQELDALGGVVADRDGQITARDERIDDLEGVARTKDQELAALVAVVAERDTKIGALNQIVESRDRQIIVRDEKIDDLEGLATITDQELDALGKAVAERDLQIDRLNRIVEDRDRQIDGLEGLARVKDRELDALGAVVANRDTRIDALNHVIEGRDGQIELLQEGVAERDGQIDSLNRAVADRDGQINGLHEVVEHRDQELSAVYASSSWRVTKPPRVVKKTLVAFARLVRRLSVRATFGTLRLLWRLAPLTRSARERRKRALLASFPALHTIDPVPARPAEPERTYAPSGWLDLADRNYEAKRNGGDVPILFDPAHYLATYEDIEVAGVDPLTHYLEYGAVEGRWPVEIDPDAIDPTIEALHRLDLASADAAAFDATFCRVLYPELAPLSDEELARVCGSGDESRIGSKAGFVRGLCDNPREIPIDFDAPEYIQLYPDLRWLTDQSPLEALRHYMRHGRWEPRLHTLRTDPAPPTAEVAALDIGVPDLLAQSARPLCVLAHVYYPELWEELSAYVGNLPRDSYDLCVNLVDDTFDPELLSRIREAFPSARVYVSKNFGRDVGGHCQLLRNLRMEDYRLFCLLHTKKSPHMGAGEAQRWRRKLIGPLMGSRECAAENIRTLLEDETIGQLGSAACRYTEMNANREKYDLLLERMNIVEESADVEFVSGTMMFLRREVLSRVFEVAGDLEFEGSGEPTVEGDGAWAHAVERVFGAVVRDMNYRFEWR